MGLIPCGIWSTSLSNQPLLFLVKFPFEVVFHTPPVIVHGPAVWILHWRLVSSKTVFLAEWLAFAPCHLIVASQPPAIPNKLTTNNHHYSLQTCFFNFSLMLQTEVKLSLNLELSFLTQKQSASSCLVLPRRYIKIEKIKTISLLSFPWFHVLCGPP